MKTRFVSRPVGLLTMCLALFVFLGFDAAAQNTRILSGTVVTPQFELVPNVTIEIETGGEKLTAVTDADGGFMLSVPSGPISVKVSGRNIQPIDLNFAAADRLENVQWKITYIIPPISEIVTIEDDVLEPAIERRDDTIYKNSLFARDDQLIFTLNAGINAGQHEGGGKSLEIRRFGFNTDHGGLNGGLKILVDNFQQNQGTQGHGQGYLGNLKSLSPELVQDVSIINGPFSAAYGDFSGLGVVQIRLKESLPQQFTARIQGGAFNTFRGFFAYSPELNNADAFIAFEPSYTDGPFDYPLEYRRDNVSGNYTYKFSDTQALGVKLNLGRNSFFSSGQIPLDEVNAGRLDRFGAIDPENGGKVQLGTVGTYYRKEWKSGATLKADAFVSRSLFDLFSNFTFFLADPIFGDEIQQHDSRLQEAGNVQFLQPYKIGNIQSLLTVGGGAHFNQINVGLYPSISRDPGRKFLPENIDNPSVLLTQANAKVNNYSGYVQNSFAFFNGHLRVDAGLRFDYFSFDVNGFELGGRDDGETPCNSDFANPNTPANPCALILDGREGSGKFQPKLAVALSPFDSIPMTFYANYGRGISSQDARGVVRQPDAPKVSTTDFYQAGTSYNGKRISLVLSSFLIDRSNEQVYITDDGSIEFAGRSRSYGVEIRNSTRFNRYLSLNAGLTQVIRSYYPGEFTSDSPRRRVIVDSAPRTVANGGLVLSELRGFNAFLNWRHISSYRLDGEDRSIKAAGHDVVDLSLTKRLRKWVDLNFSIDNVLNKKYYETQNFFESRIAPGADVISRIHATPGYPFTVSAGLTFRFGAKN
ncbi:MAG: TonB-dependent receptor [Pyrinomonadaceae bacterium]